MGIIVSLTMISLIMVSFFVWISSELFFDSSCADAALVDKIIVKSIKYFVEVYAEFPIFVYSFTSFSFFSFHNFA